MAHDYARSSSEALPATRGRNQPRLSRTMLGMTLARRQTARVPSNRLEGRTATPGTKIGSVRTKVESFGVGSWISHKEDR